MPERAADAQVSIHRAIRRLREHSRGCDCIETRHFLIKTERWMVWMLRRIEEGCEGEDLPLPAEIAG
ncbi:hypothetical protein [Azospirillum picis]|uniref:Uncharacterized protein n=1 Tax=Azospirillum picis TaxID=488438 RepID=A0ABU0MD11_9PROT|nr:hypothetical protein [Azospirillum picis]MBP2297654.1 hypothetical protein [Azospirillum picis]MDQ0531323.1 hypothetical protein [Azospirillum picis]